MSRSKSIAEDHTGWRHMAAARVGPGSHRAPIALQADPRSRGSDEANHTNVAATRVQFDRRGPRRSPIAQATATGVEFPVERHPPASAEHTDWGMSYAFAR